MGTGSWRVTHQGGPWCVLAHVRCLSRVSFLLCVWHLCDWIFPPSPILVAAPCVLALPVSMSLGDFSQTLILRRKEKWRKFIRL